MTQRDRFVKALIARGYQRAEPRSHYLVFRGPAVHPLFPDEPDTIRLLVGSSGALRYTKGRISESHPVSDNMKALLLMGTEKPKAAPDDLVL